MNSSTKQPRPAGDWNRLWIAIGVTASLAGLITAWGIHVIGKYGMVLFILTPLLMGILSAVLFGYKRGITVKEARRVGFLTLGVFTTGLLVTGEEGLACIAMAMPLGILLTWIGSLLGYFFVDKTPGTAHITTLIFLCCIPAVSFVEKDQEPVLTSVTTTIDIHADPQTVWQNVIAFPQLREPTEFLFQTGIAYPINATIDGTGVGAVRHCNFTTGSFVEPITVWDEPRLLKFDVAQQPQPLKELSFWDIDAPHLHDYFVSKQGQFHLIKLANGDTRLEGTTWYYHDIRPAFYWKLWSDYIIHTIHLRVLNHIRENAEKAR